MRAKQPPRTDSELACLLSVLWDLTLNAHTDLPITPLNPRIHTRAHKSIQFHRLKTYPHRNPILRSIGPSIRAPVRISTQYKHSNRTHSESGIVFDAGTGSQTRVTAGTFGRVERRLTEALLNVAGKAVRSCSFVSARLHLPTLVLTRSPCQTPLTFPIPDSLAGLETRQDRFETEVGARLTSFETLINELMPRVPGKSALAPTALVKGNTRTCIELSAHLAIKAINNDL